MEHQKLIDLRKAKKLTQKQMALKIAMEQTTYSRKERGKSPITDDEWKRFARVLGTEIEEIKEVHEPATIKNENCTFHDSSLIGVQYVNIPQNVFDIIIKYNAKLEEENQMLKAQVSKMG